MITSKKPTSFIKEKLQAVGDFYMRHRKFFAMVKLVLLVGVMVFAFSTRTPSGKVVHHGVSTTYAGGSGVCGNAICESSDASCAVSNTDCTKITGIAACAAISGCTVKDVLIYACSGTTFSCTGISNSTTCLQVGCFRGSNNSCSNDDGKGKIAPETCSTLVQQSQCAAVPATAGNCSRTKISSTQSCAGTITKLTKESDCTTLSGLIISFGLTAIRTPAYTEDSATCPQDCPAIVCGNGIKETGETCDDGASNGIPGKCNSTCNGTTPVCGNGVKEGVETCDDGASNGVVGKCNSTCSGIVPAACTGTIIANSKTCNSLALAMPSMECSTYYSTGGMQCKYDSAMLKCKDSSSCTVVAVAVCGNGVKETGETCDDGGKNSDTNIGACKTTCDGFVSAPTCTETEAITLDLSSPQYSSTAGTVVFDINAASLHEKDGITTLSIDKNTWTKEIALKEGNTTIYVSKDGGKTFITLSNINFIEKTSVSFEILGDCPPATTCIETEAITLNLSSPQYLSTAGIVVFDGVARLKSKDGITTLSIDKNTWTKEIALKEAKTVYASKDGGKTFVTLSNINFIYGVSVSFEILGDCPAECIETEAITLNLSSRQYLSTAGIIYFDGGARLREKDGITVFSIDKTKRFGEIALKETKTIYVSKDGGKTFITLSIVNFVAGVSVSFEILGDCPAADCDGAECYEYTKDCGNNIVDKGEVCDNGINNGKPGQCNSTCNGWLAYNGSCGDKTCGSYCAIDPNATCDSLNANESTKNLCSTLGCFLQTKNIYDCAGTVSCEKITKSTMYNDQYMVGKYCNLAGCSYDNKSGLCSTPSKAPSCSKLPAAEYCKMLSPMGCSLTTDGVSTTCVGNTALRADKLDSNQCTTINGKRNTEDENSCPSDCKATCTTTETESCSSLSVAECTNYFAQNTNCMVSKDVCTDGSACNSCGNNVCDNKETYSTCPSDCNVTDWPSVSYTPNLPKDGSLITGPVVAKVKFGDGCKILNNNASTSYTFNYNGYFIFKVSCPWLDGKVLDIGAKVYRLQNNAKEMTNLAAISTTSGSTLYCENKNNLIGEVAANNTTMIEMAKKAIYEQSLTSSSSTLKSEFSDKVTVSGNISFVNGSNTLTKIELTKDLLGTATKATLTIPANSTVKSENSKGQKSDFSGLFLAPTLASDTIVDKLSTQIKNEKNNDVAVVLKVGDEENTKLTVVDTGDEAEEFIISLQLTGYQEGDEVEILSSQDGEVWTSYGFTTVNDKGEVNFAVPHLTYYGIASEGETTSEGGDTTTPTSSNGGGGGAGAPINQCTADRDCKNNYLTTLCGPCSEAEKVAEIKVKQNAVVCYSYSPELNGAYSFAYANAITTIADCEKANLNGDLLRSHMAKMMSNFAINTLGLKPNTGAFCEFTDMDSETTEMKFYAKLACQLGLMGLDTDGKANTIFTPNQVVTRAQFGTVLSRLLRGNKNNGGEIYYQKHLQALQDAEIMTKIDEPSNKEMRGRTMLMMQRITNKVSPAENGGKTLWELIQEFFTK